MNQIAWTRIVFIFIGLGVILLMFLYGEDYTKGNAEALKVLVTTFSILAGMLVAIMALVGNSGKLSSGSWRRASVHSRQIKRQLDRCKLLFYIYLIVIGLIYVATLFGNADMDKDIVHMIEHITLSFGAGVFFWSLGLPYIIVRTYKDRFDEEVEDRRKSRKNSQNGVKQRKFDA